VTGLLDQIQKLQFSDKPAAEVLLLGFVRETFPHLAIKSLSLRPLAVSLNSFNGFLTLENGETLFFKTHTEPDGVVGEYYRAEQLAKAGYPILQPILQSHEADKQLLIYPYVDAPSVFDAAWEIELGDMTRSKLLEAAQNRLDDELFTLYKSTLAWQSAEDAEQSPVHQLFYHRLTAGRLDRFYYDPQASFQIADKTFSFDQLSQFRWKINGSHYGETLSTMLERAKRLTHPRRVGASIIGHGDAHNGNVFFHDAGSAPAHLSYFDPAFAGRHHPLLDLTKPLFHNVFCMWMYFPLAKDEALRLRAMLRNDEIVITHDYQIAPVRHMFLRSKVERVLIPTLVELKRRGWLDTVWREFLKTALFCCPLLTRNLADKAIFPPQLGLLGLSQAVEMCSESSGQRSLIDQTLDEVEQAIR
jgi:hypothetical protein